MAFFQSAIDVLKTLVIALGAGLPRREEPGHEASHGKIVGTISRKGIHNPDASSFTSPDC